MKQIKPHKLKRKIWIISTIILSAYIIALISNPTVWTALLPVIIPSAILTIGIPGYAITKHIKYMLEKETLKLSKSEDKIESLQNTKQTEKKVTNNITENKKIDVVLEPQYEQTTIKKDKPKVKTKGTRY